MEGDPSSGDGCPTNMCPRSGVSNFTVSVPEFVDSRNGSSRASGKKDFSDDDDDEMMSGAAEFLISCVRLWPSSSTTSGEDSFGLMLSFSLGIREYLLNPVS